MRQLNLARGLAQLIAFFSKNLLRHPLARSNLEDMTGDTIFERYLPEPHPAELEAPENIKRHILCTGKPSRARDRKIGLL
jgi:2-oxoglutarate dehydrogenase E1 component